MQRLLVHVVVLLRLLVQEVKEVFDCRRNDGVGTQHAAEEVVHELLQRALEESTRTSVCTRLPTRPSSWTETHLDGQQPGQVDLGDRLGHGLVLHAAALRLHFIDVVGRPHQVEGVVLLQQRVLCSKKKNLKSSSYIQVCVCVCAHTLFAAVLMLVKRLCV